MAHTETRPWLSSYGPGVPGRLEYGDLTVGDLLRRSAARFPDRPAMDFLGAVSTYRTFADEVARAAGGLARLGVRPGDAVAIVLPNCPQHLVAFYAVLHLGATVVEHNPLYTESELVGPFRDHGATVAIVWDKVVPVVERLRERGAPIEHIVAVDMTRAMPWTVRAKLRLPVPAARRSRRRLTAPAPGAIPWPTLLSGRAAPIHAVSPADVALLLYTSGTTGRPKGVPLTHANLVANVLMGAAWVPGMVPGRESVLCLLPMFHAYGVTITVLFAVNAGAKLILLPAPEIDLIMESFRREVPTFVPAVPPLYARIVDEAQRRGVSIRGVRNSLSGAMALPSELVERWEQATGGLLVEGYGLTECSPVAVGNPMTTDRRPGSIGVPFPDTEIRVAGLEDLDVDVPVGERGELLLRGPQVFGGYRHDPEATSAAFHRGWFRTGDVVVMSPDGFLTIVDRIKEVIVTGGFNVYPSEVEEVLRAHDSVADCAVVPVRQPDGSEQVGAVVVMAEGQALDPEALRVHAKLSLTPYKVPRHYLAVDDLPRNPMGKILRAEAAALFDERSES